MTSKSPQHQVQFTDPATRRSVATAKTQSAPAEQSPAQTNEQFVSENPQHRVVQRKLRFEDTVIDPSVQRPENVSEINSIARDFNPAALGVPTVSARVDAQGNETYVVLDGQQRRAAALKVGYHELVPFTIHYGLLAKEEAVLFRQLNFRKAVSAAVLFKTSLVEENPVSLAIQRICDGLGIKIGTPDGLMAVDLARRLATTKDGLQHFRWALEEIQAIFDPNREGGVYDARVIEAFTVLHRHYEGKLDVKRLERKLSAVGSVQHLIGRGQNVRSFKGGRISMCILDAIVERYNHNYGGRGKHALPEIQRRQGKYITVADALDEPADE